MKHNKGVTLVELLVSMSIMVIFASVVLTSFKRQPPEAQLEQAAIEVRSAILTARNLALAPQIKYAAPATGTPAQYFSAKITSNNVDVIKYDTIGTSSILQGYSKKLPSKISSSSDWEIKFKVAANEISFNPSTTSSIDITHSSITTGRKATISVDSMTGYSDIIIQ